MSDPFHIALSHLMLYKTEMMSAALKYVPSVIYCIVYCVNLLRQEHKVEAISSVPLSFVQRGSLLHQVLQSLGVHLQAADQVVHVRLTGLVVQVTVSKQTYTALLSTYFCHLMN